MKSSTLNTTAYRIFKTLQWLCESPLSVEELNRKFQDDPMINRTLSEDSVWLYINTLKTLGCEITRPVPSNGFRYQLLYHPFGNILAPEDIDTLTDAKTVAEAKMSYPEILCLDRFFKKMLAYSSLPERKTLIEDMFSTSRSVDYEARMETIDRLGEAVQDRRLLFVTYQSPAKGSESFYFLPEALMYQGGVLYLNGSRLGRENLVMLRVERIESFEITEQPDLYEQLEKIQSGRIHVVVRLYAASALPVEILGPGEQVRRVGHADPPYMEITLETRDLFLLKQKLLELGLPFDVVEPESFRADVLQTLLAMNRLYARVEA